MELNPVNKKPVWTMWAIGIVADYLCIASRIKIKLNPTDLRLNHALSLRSQPSHYVSNLERLISINQPHHGVDGDQSTGTANPRAAVNYDRSVGVDLTHVLGVAEKRDWWWRDTMIGPGGEVEMSHKVDGIGLKENK